MEMVRDGLLTRGNDGNVPKLRAGASHPSIDTPLRLSQSQYTTINVLQVPSHGMMATSDLGLNHGVDQTRSSLPLDISNQLGSGMSSSSLSHNYPYEHGCSPQHLEYNNTAQCNHEYQYNLNTALLTNASSLPEARQVSVPIPVTPTMSEHSSQDDTRSFTPTRAHRNLAAWSQSPPSSQLESSARSLVVPTPTAANMSIRSGYPYITSSQPFGSGDHRSGMKASHPSPYSNPNMSASGMFRSSDSHVIRHPHLSLQHHIQRHRQYGSRKSTLKSGSPYDEPLYTHPKHAYPKVWVPESFLFAYPDGQSNKASLGTSEWSSGVHLKGASGVQFQGPTLSPGATHGDPSWAMGSPLPTYYGSSNPANQTRRIQPGSPPQVQRHHQYGNWKSAPDSSSSYGEPLYASGPPNARGYATTSSAYAFTDGRDLPHHANLESTHPADGLPFPTRNIRPISGRNHGPTFQPFENPGDEGEVVAGAPSPYSGRNMQVDKTPRPQFTRQGHVPAYIGRGQGPPATTHTEGHGNNPASSFDSSDDQQNYSFRNPGPSTFIIPTRTHTEPFYEQCNTRELAPFTSPVDQSDLALGASPTRSFSYLSFNDTWSSQFNPQGQPLDNPPPSHMSPVRHGTPRQHISIPTPSYANLDTISPGLRCAMDEGHSAPSTLALADEWRNNSALTTINYPPTTFNIQERLERALGRSSPLTNKALIKLLLLIFSADFFLMQEMEPTIDSDYGQVLLGQIQQIAGCPDKASHVSNDSIFTLFVSKCKFRCLICGSPKQSMVRGIGCVRSHLDHRPFPCRGDGGCNTCPKDRIVRRFFTASLLRDHCNRQERKTTCTSCGVVLRGGMKRHWEAKHPDTPFPY